MLPRSSEINRYFVKRSRLDPKRITFEKNIRAHMGPYGPQPGPGPSSLEDECLSAKQAFIFSLEIKPFAFFLIDKYIISDTRISRRICLPAGLGPSPCWGPVRVGAHMGHIWAQRIRFCLKTH